MGSNNDPVSDFLAQFPLPFSSSSGKRDQEIKLATGKMIVPDVQQKILDLEKILSVQSPLPKKPHNQNLLPGKSMDDARRNLSKITKKPFQGQKQFNQERTFAKNDPNYRISGRQRLSKFTNTCSLVPRDLDRLSDFRKDLSQDYTDSMRQQLLRATSRPYPVPRHHSQQIANFPSEIPKELYQQETFKINPFSNYNHSSRPHLQNITKIPFRMSNEYEKNRLQNYQDYVGQPQMIFDGQIGLNKIPTQNYGDYGHQQMLKGTNNPEFTKDHQVDYSDKSHNYIDYGHQHLSKVAINTAQIPEELVQDDYSVHSPIRIDYGHQHASKVTNNSQFSKELDQGIASTKYETDEHHRRFEDAKRNYFQGPEELEKQNLQSKKIKLQAHQQLTHEQLLPAEELNRFQSSSFTLYQECTSENQQGEAARRKYTWTKDQADKNNISDGNVHQQSTKVTNNFVVVQNVQVMSNQPPTEVSEIKIQKKPPEVDSEITQSLKLDPMVKQDKNTGKCQKASDTAATSKKPKVEISEKYIEVAIMKNNFPSGKFTDKEIRVLRKRITEGILSLLDTISSQALPKIENFKNSSGVLLVKCRDNGTTVDWLKNEFNDNPNVLPDCTLKVILTSEIKVAIEQQTKTETTRNVPETATASIEPPIVNTTEKQSETTVTSNDFPAEEDIEPEILVICVLTQ